MENIMEHFINLFSEALEKDSGQIHEEDEFRNYEEWDSLAVLSVIAMIKTIYNITIPRKDFDELNTISELFEYLQAHR